RPGNVVPDLRLQDFRQVSLAPPSRRLGRRRPLRARVALAIMASAKRTILGNAMTHRVSRRAVLAQAAGLAAAALPLPVRADWRPTQTIRVIAPAAPGGTTDLMARLLAQHLQNAWDATTAVENKSGGGGTIAMTDFVRQKPDGHTIMLANPGPNAVAYSIFRNLAYKADQLQP